MGQRGCPAIPELQAPTGEVKAATVEFKDGANSRFSEVTGLGIYWREIIYPQASHLISPYPSLSNALLDLLPSSSLD